MPCYFRQALQRFFNWAVAARKLYPNKRILATKLDVKAAYRQCHLNTTIATQTCTHLPSEGLDLLMLQHTFGGSPCPLAPLPSQSVISQMPRRMESFIPPIASSAFYTKQDYFGGWHPFRHWKRSHRRHPSRLKRHSRPVHQQFLWPDGGTTTHHISKELRF